LLDHQGLGVYTLGGIMTENRLDHINDTWRTCHTTDRDDLIDVRRLDAGKDRQYVGREEP
jgi:hypothetical protein